MADRDKKKKKAGLHKEISSIFDGVPIPREEVASRPPVRPDRKPLEAPGRSGYESPRPPAARPENPHIPGSYPRVKQVGVAGAAGGIGVRPAGGGVLQRIAGKVFAPRPGVSARRQKFLAMLVPVLLVILIVMLSRMLATPGKKRPARPAPPEPGSVAERLETEIEWQMPEPYPAGLRDPMELTEEMSARIKAKAEAEETTGEVGGRAEAAEEEEGVTAVGELTVKGILYSHDRPAAVIGTRIAHVGDVIAGAKVIRITRDTVEFEKDGRKWTQSVEAGE